MEKPDWVSKTLSTSPKSPTVPWGRFLNLFGILLGFSKIRIKLPLAAPSRCPHNMWLQFASMIISFLRFSQRSRLVLCLQFQAQCLVCSNFSVTSLRRIQGMNDPKCIPKPKSPFCGTAGCLSRFYRQWGKMFPRSLLNQLCSVILSSSTWEIIFPEPHWGRPGRRVLLLQSLGWTGVHAHGAGAKQTSYYNIFMTDSAGWSLSFSCNPFCWADISGAKEKK